MISEQEIVEQLRKLNDEQQKQVIAFIKTLTLTPAPVAEETWSPAEIQALMEAYRHPEPQTGAEISAFLHEVGTTGWEYIEDSVAWVAEQRQRSKERRQW